MSILFQIAAFRLHLQSLRSAIVASYRSSNWNMKVSLNSLCGSAKLPDQRDLPASLDSAIRRMLSE